MDRHAEKFRSNSQISKVQEATDKLMAERRANVLDQLNKLGFHSAARYIRALEQELSKERDRVRYARILGFAQHVGPPDLPVGKVGHGQHVQKIPDTQPLPKNHPKLKAYE